MQVVQLLGGPDGRAAMLGAVRGAVAPGGVLAVALADPFEAIPAGEALPPLPDILERDGWVFSSLPVAVRDEGERGGDRPLRQAVSPSGDLTDEFATITLDTVEPRDARGRGRSPPATVLAGRRTSPRRAITSGARLSCWRRR